MRTINEIIIHCTDTELGNDYSVTEIDKWHRKRGFAEIGYHYIIHPDGMIDIGRAVTKVGAHCKGHNRYTIGVAYIGGRKDGKYTNTMTTFQVIAMTNLLNLLCLMYPSIKAINGHNHYSSKLCPCFNVPKFVKEMEIKTFAERHKD